jgi:hypothetical protein
MSKIEPITNNFTNARKLKNAQANLNGALKGSFRRGSSASANTIQTYQTEVRELEAIVEAERNEAIKQVVQDYLEWPNDEWVHLKNLYMDLHLFKDPETGQPKITKWELNVSMQRTIKTESTRRDWK